MTGPDAYVNVGRITSSTGAVIVEEVKVSAEGLAIILFEDQLYKVQESIRKRQAEIRRLEELLCEDYQAASRLSSAITELQGRRYV